MPIPVINIPKLPLQYRFRITFSLFVSRSLWGVVQGAIGDLVGLVWDFPDS